MIHIIATHFFEETTLLYYAASVEQASEHPLAQAIVEYAKKQSIQLNEPSDFQAMTGQGASAIVGGKVALLGNQSFMAAHQFSVDELLDQSHEIANLSEVSS